MKNCKFEAIYNDLEEGQIFKRWTCDQKIDEKSYKLNVFCAFHDKRKLQWNDEIYGKFENRVRKSIEDNCVKNFLN
jgi:hypothetical protein